MSSITPKSPESSTRKLGELTRTHAEMLAAVAEARAAERLVELEALCSPLNTPEQRIRAWERAHRLALPRDPHHPILNAIALKTGLTLEQVQAVEQNEAARRMTRTAP